MKGALPTLDHLSRLYYELGRIGARSVGQKKPWSHRFSNKEELFLVAAEWSRFDPRLLEILVQYSLGFWKTVLPQNLREGFKNMETPQTLGVLSAFLHTAKPQEREMIFFWDFVTKDLEPVEPQFYFRGLYPPGSKLALRGATESLAEFKQWGFLGRQRVIVDPITKKTVGSWEQPERLHILRRLFLERKQLQISDYLEEVEHSISRQQALLDLKSIKAIQHAQGRAAYWVL